MHDVGNYELANVCFNKAFEFVAAAVELAQQNGRIKRIPKAIFDLHMGAAECCWERKELDTALKLVKAASEQIEEIPEEIDFLAG